MQQGSIVEHGSVADIFGNPQHPYTATLLESIPAGITNLANTTQPKPREVFRKEQIA
jgi:peptide/nickel transport system ATP-binding protein